MHGCHYLSRGKGQTMSEVMTIYSNNGAVKIVTDGEYYYIQNGDCYERFDSLESAKEIAMSLY